MESEVLRDFVWYFTGTCRAHALTSALHCYFRIKNCSKDLLWIVTLDNRSVKSMRKLGIDRDTTR